MSWWQFFRAPATCRARSAGSLRRDCAALVPLERPSLQVVVPFLVGARRSAFRSSPTSPAGTTPSARAVIAPFCDIYVVQNATMRDDLVRYHDVTARADRGHGLAADRRLRAGPANWEEFDRLVVSYGLDPALALVVVMGNTPTNAPYEGTFVERLVCWWGEGPRTDVLAPLPSASARREWRERFAAAFSPRSDVQEASFTDLEILATVLQHAAASSRMPARSSSRRSSTTACGVRAVRRGRAGRKLGRTCRRALPGARPRPQRSTEPSVSRRSSRHRALARAPGELAAERQRVARGRRRGRRAAGGARGGRDRGVVAS